MHTQPRLKILLTAAVALAGVACSQPGTRTVGQRIDSTVAKVEQRAEEVKAEIKQELVRAKSDTVVASDTLAHRLESVADKVADTVQDAAITASVHAELAKDDRLSALTIDVDSHRGAVRLLGTAPDADARDRATRLAAGVQGVRSVDNRLVVRG